MTLRKRMTLCILLATLSCPALAEPDMSAWLDGALASADAPAETYESAPAVAMSAEPAEQEYVKTPPLPFHCIEGYAGGAITPMAYMTNCGPKGCRASMPSVAYSVVNLGSKWLHAVTVNQTFFQRIEVGYAFNYLDVGSLGDDVRKAGLDMGREHVRLHHFNLRANVLPENSFDLPLPAVTAGVHVKYNQDTDTINDNLGGALKSIGYNQEVGVDYTLTATKMLPELAFGRPIILTAGLRFSKAAQLGYLGFGDECVPTVEGSVCYLPLDELCLAYEFRGKENPYDEIPTLIGPEDNWHAFSASWIVNNRLTITGVYGLFGTIANAQANCALALQVKYEF